MSDVYLGALAASCVALGANICVGFGVWRLRRIEAELERLSRQVEVAALEAAIDRPVRREPVFPDVGALMTCQPDEDEPPIHHIGGYRTAPISRRLPAPRRGLRAVGYLGNALALRVRETTFARLVWAHLRGAMARILWAAKTEPRLRYTSRWDHRGFETIKRQFVRVPRGSMEEEEWSE